MNSSHATSFFSRLATGLLSVLPSRRFCIYLGLSALVWALGAIFRAVLPIAGLLNGLLVFVALLDLWFSPQPRDFEVWREFEPKMNLGATNSIALHAKSRAKLSVRLQIRDEPPVSWPIHNDEPPRERDGTILPPLPRVTLETEPNGESSARYQLTPPRRGDFGFGPLCARFSTALGFWTRQFQTEMPPEKSVARVFPDISEVRRYELALREGKMRDIGLHILRLRGRGTEFESLREYSAGDEYKSIDWKASARRGKLISTNYEVERDQTILICLDCGRMMTSMAVSRESDVEVTPLSKLDCAINATVLLAHVAASMGDSVGLLLFSDGILKFLPPRKGRVQTGTIIEALYSAQPSLVEPDYQAAYEYLLARKLRRSLVVTFTDIIDPEASRELLNASGALRRHHNALCITISNRDVNDMAAQMPVSSEDLYEKAMAQRMLTQRAGALEQLRTHGVGILDVEAAHLTPATVNRYLDLKSRGAL